MPFWLAAAESSHDNSGLSSPWEQDDLWYNHGCNWDLGASETCFTADNSSYTSHVNDPTWWNDQFGGTAFMPTWENRTPCEVGGEDNCRGVEKWMLQGEDTKCFLNCGDALAADIASRPLFNARITQNVDAVFIPAWVDPSHSEVNT